MWSVISQRRCIRAHLWLTAHWAANVSHLQWWLRKKCAEFAESEWCSTFYGGTHNDPIDHACTCYLWDCRGGARVYFGESWAYAHTVIWAMPFLTLGSSQILNVIFNYSMSRNDQPSDWMPQIHINDAIIQNLSLKQTYHMNCIVYAVVTCCLHHNWCSTETFK